jgi:hypothetical protein
MRARYMDPNLGRFLNEDPAHDGQNWYVYSMNSPAVFSDRNGTTADKAKDALVAGSLVFYLAFLAAQVQMRILGDWNGTMGLIFAGAALVGIGMMTIGLVGIDRGPNKAASIYSLFPTSFVVGMGLWLSRSVKMAEEMGGKLGAAGQQAMALMATYTAAQWAALGATYIE